MVDSTNLWEVVDVKIKNGIKRSYKIATLEEHLKIERVDNGRFLIRLSELMS
jgi:hypothetical protein